MKWIFVLLVASLAGCIQTVDDEPALALSATGIPESIRLGDSFSFELDVTGDGESDHVGAHYWAASTDDPDADFSMAKGCAHQPGVTEFPATLTVTCTPDAAGAMYFRGHVRVSGDETLNFWAAEQMVNVLDYELTASDNGAEATTGEAYTFTLAIAGDATTTSDHIGAHYWTTPPSDPTAEFGEQAGGCAHQPEPKSVPATFTVTCTWDQAGTYTVHGHLRIAVGDANESWWTEGFEVTVS